ncbi:MAG: hypothetical protein LBV04_08930 [Deferribacteraceae bacterium]|nr:hypothetical protein [Deferribacteraceae bacterium]
MLRKMWRYCLAVLMIVLFTACANKLVVGTFNIDVKAPNNLVSDQRELLAAHGVEIFGIQEVDVNLPRYDQAVYDPFTDFVVSTYKDGYFGMSIAKKGEGGYGNGVVSAFALQEKSVTELYGAAQADQALQQEIYATYKLWDMSDPAFKAAMDKMWSKEGAMAKGGIEPRTYSRVVFEKDGKRIAFYSTHLSVESATVRTEQLKELKIALDNDLVEYKIMVGDFNTDKGTNEYDIFTSAGYKIANGHNDTWYNTVSKDEKARVGMGIDANVRYLDNIIVSANISINYVQMINTTLSDHNPLIAGLTLN